jgi:hypothetical protein
VAHESCKTRNAGVAELADAQASGACGRKIVWVQVPSPALFFALRIKNWSGGPIRITLPGMMQKLPGRVFLFLCGEDVQTGKEKQTNLRQCKIV